MTLLSKGEELDNHVNKLCDEVRNYKNNKIFMNDNKKYKLTKLKDEAYNGEHPYGINEGYTKEGYLYSKPVKGFCFYFNNLRTSKVTEIIDDNTFRTENSIYKIEELDE